MYGCQTSLLQAFDLTFPVMANGLCGHWCIHVLTHSNIAMSCLWFPFRCAVLPRNRTHNISGALSVRAIHVYLFNSLYMQARTCTPLTLLKSFIRSSPVTHQHSSIRLPRLSPGGSVKNVSSSGILAQGVALEVAPVLTCMSTADKHFGCSESPTRQSIVGAPPRHSSERWACSDSSSCGSSLLNVSALKKPLG